MPVDVDREHVEGVVELEPAAPDEPGRWAGDQQLVARGHLTCRLVGDRRR